VRGERKHGELRYRRGLGERSIVTSSPVLGSRIVMAASVPLHERNA
jgi:hypothetical protein